MNLLTRYARQTHHRLWSLAYRSTMSRFLSEDELYELAAQSEQRNRQLSLSGVLLLDDNHFFQILEGEREAVHYIYRCILSDCRHVSVLKLADSRIARREFGGWAMRLITTDDISSVEGRIAARGLEAAEYPSDQPGRIDLAPLKACMSAVARGVYRKPPL